MKKSVYTREHGQFVALLRETREEQGFTQVRLAKVLGKSQSFISKWERGEVRLDIIQLRIICHALGITLQEFVNRLEARLRSPSRK